jgi:hypothetical protein
MKSLATLPAEERALYWRTYSERKGVPNFIVEKDFWVCWLLGRIFATPRLGADCVFKGGTSLSKVFGVINRFSEDIDLAVSPTSLGWKEADLDDAPSTKQRQKRAKKLEAVSHSPVIFFAYPQAVPAGSYIAPVVKVEFGSLTDQRPTGTHSVTPLIAELGLEAFSDLRAEVVALEIERTFWEKATILHAEYHRPAAQPIRDRFARHYSDFAALWRHPGGRSMATRFDLLDRVRAHKSKFFGSSWANYETAAPGTFRLIAPEARLAELRRDYSAMEPMFLSPAPRFEEVIDALREAEHAINATG